MVYGFPLTTGEVQRSSIKAIQPWIAVASENALKSRNGVFRPSLCEARLSYRLECKQTVRVFFKNLNCQLFRQGRLILAKGNNHSLNR